MRPIRFPNFTAIMAEQTPDDNPAELLGLSYARRQLDRVTRRPVIRNPALPHFG